MSEEEVCIACGSSERPLDIHEPPGRAVSLLVQCPVCGVPCHKNLTEKQRAAGFNLDHKHEHSDLSRDYQLLSGTSQVLAAIALSLGFDFAVRMGRLCVRATATVLAALSRVGEEIGPQPILSDARRERWRRQRLLEYEIPAATRSESIDRRRSVRILRLIEDTLAAMGNDPGYFSLPNDVARLLVISRLEELRATGGWTLLLNQFVGLASEWMWHVVRLASIKRRDSIPTILDAGNNLAQRTDRVVSFARSLASPSVVPEEALAQLLQDLWRW